MPINISPTSPAPKQRHQCDTYIRTHTKRCNFSTKSNPNIPLTFLPPSAIAKLATLPNIYAILARDPGLDLIKYPYPERALLAQKLFTSARKCFVVALFARLDMAFLLHFTNIALDADLPVDEPYLIDLKYRNDYHAFMRHQHLVCAASFQLGRYDQVVPALRWLPFVEAHLRREGSGGEEFRVVVHAEYVVEAGGGRYVGDGRFRMEVFENPEGFTRRVVLEKRGFGFECEGRYYVCYRPRGWMAI